MTKIDPFVAKVQLQHGGGFVNWNKVKQNLNTAGEYAKAVSLPLSIIGLQILSKMMTNEGRQQQAADQILRNINQAQAIYNIARYPNSLLKSSHLV